MANRFLIGRGELLTHEIPPPPSIPKKSHPYTLDEARKAILPQLRQVIADQKTLPAAACPRDIAVAKLDLHPTYIAKSFFPKSLLRAAGLIPIGSRTVRVRPRKDVRKRASSESDTTELFVAGTRGAFSQFPAMVEQLAEGTPEALQFAEIESIASLTADDRLRTRGETSREIFEIALHLIPDEQPEQTRTAFAEYAQTCEFELNTEFDFLVGRMLFVAARGNARNLGKLALFSLVRLVRPMPALRGSKPFTRANALSIPFALPNAQPLSVEPSVAILDGGLPDKHVLASYVRHYEKSDPTAQDVVDYLDHGLGVTSAFLFGPIEPNAEASRPYAYVDHFRVLDEKSSAEDPYELYRTLAHVEEILLSRRYQFLNLSLGPDLPAEDSDIHAWTAVLDSVLSDGETLMTVAVGNNGEADAKAKLNRIQVPADSVNALSVGAANRSAAPWDRAPYSACGPGRSPGRRKPDLLAFGGCPKEYFHVAAQGVKPELAATMGTSYSAPLTLRTAVGIRAILGEAVHPLTIKALMIHSAECPKVANPDEIGWGRALIDVGSIITCGDGIARILYQGSLRPGKYLRAPVPLPATALEGKVTLSATFCYASPVDIEDAAAYTKAGLTISFRPNAKKVSGKRNTPKTREFFSSKTFRTEQEQRADLGKWETVIHASHTMYGHNLNSATFDIHYNAREGGAPAGAGTEIIPYALVLSVQAKRHANLYEEILAAHKILQPIEPRVSVPIST